MPSLDHLVVAAATLQEGVEYVENRLGVTMAPGGQHPRMGTHNAVLRLGDGIYLEVIAVDPDAESPDRPRWFGLDQPLVRAQLQQRPRLLHWVVNTPDIETTRSRCPIPPGRVEAMSRGELHWLITIPEDGSLPAGGVLPSLIQWRTESHPAGRMPETGCRLERLILHHSPAEWLNRTLYASGIDGLIERQSLPTDSPPYLEALIETPTGIRVLR